MGFPEGISWFLTIVLILATVGRLIPGNTGSRCATIDSVRLRRVRNFVLATMATIRFLAITLRLTLIV